MAAMQLIKVQVLRRFSVPCERVFDAFLDPAKAGKFMFATENGEMIKAEIDPTVGGEFVFIDRRPNGDAEHYGTYVEIKRPNRLSFTFSVQKKSAEADPVTIEIKPKGPGCELVLTHEMSPRFEEFKDRVAEGWTSILAGLAANL